MSNDSYGNLMPIGPQTRLFQSSVERQKRQAIELVQAQAEVVRVADVCRLGLTIQAMNNVTALVAMGERLAAENPSAAGQLEHLVTAYRNAAYFRIQSFS